MTTTRQGDMRGSKFCPDMRVGRVCGKGRSCGFAHSLGELQQHPDYKTMPCFSFERRGMCAEGEMCRYAHGPGELRRGRGRVERGVPPPPLEDGNGANTARGAAGGATGATAVASKTATNGSTTATVTPAADAADAADVAVYIPSTMSTGMSVGMSKNAARTAAIEINGRLVGAQTAGDVLKVIRGIDFNHCPPEFDGVCVATAFHRLAAAGPGADAIDSSEFRNLMRVARVKDMAIRNLSNVIWACGKMMPAVAACRELAATVEHLVVRVSTQLAGTPIGVEVPEDGAKDVVPQNLSNIMWGLVELRTVVDTGSDAVAGLVAQVERHMVPRMGDFLPQNISNTLLAFHKLGIRRVAEETLDAIEMQIEKTSAELFSPQAASNILFALGAVGGGRFVLDFRSCSILFYRSRSRSLSLALVRPSVRFATVDHLIDASMRNIADFNAQNAAMALKGLALRGQAPRQHPGCLERFAEVVATAGRGRGPDAMATPQNISDTIWSLGRLGFRDQRTLDEISGMLCQSGARVEIDHLLAVAWGYGSVGQPTNEAVLRFAKDTFQTK